MPVMAWAGGSGQLRVYRVNRRPLAVPSLFDEADPLAAPDQSWAHLLAIVGSVTTQVTGKPPRQRRWSLGNVVLTEHDGEEVLLAILGFTRSEESSDLKFNEAERRWTASSGAQQVGEVVPVIVEPQGRLLGVLDRPDFGRIRVGQVLSSMLQGADDFRISNDESISADRSVVEWSVELVERRDAFYTWVKQTPVVRTVTMKLRPPNPDSPEALREAMDAIRRRRADYELTRWSTNHPEGLSNLADDPEVGVHAEAAHNAWGSITADGRTETGTKTKYSSATSHARAPLGELADTAAGLLDQMAKSLRAFRQRWLGEGE